MKVVDTSTYSHKMLFEAISTDDISGKITLSGEDTITEKTAIRRERKKRTVDKNKK